MSEQEMTTEKTVKQSYVFEGFEEALSELPDSFNLGAKNDPCAKGVVQQDANIENPEKQAVSNIVNVLLNDHKVCEIGNRLSSAKKLMQSYDKSAEDYQKWISDGKIQSKNYQTEQLAGFWSAVEQVYTQVNGMGSELGAYMLEDLSQKLSANGIDDTTFLEKLSRHDANALNNSIDSGIHHIQQKSSCGFKM